MLNKTFTLVALTLAAFCSIAIQETNAKPPYDLDYEVYVGINSWKYEIWVDPVDGPPYKDSTHYSQYDASWRMFKMYEWNQVPTGADVWMETVSYINWEYFLTFETWTEAQGSTDDWEALGFPTKIVSVFGGYLPPANSTPYGSADINTGYLLNIALILDEENDDEEDMQIMAASNSSFSVIRSPRQD